MSEAKTELRKAVRKGYYGVPGGGFRVVEPGEQIYVPVDFKASWLEKVEDEKSKPAAKSDDKAKAS